MTITSELTEDYSIIKSDLSILFYWIFGIVMIFSGGVALNATNSNPQTGFPLIAIGFAFVTYGLNKFSGLKSGKIITEILTKVYAIERDLHQLINRVFANSKVIQSANPKLIHPI